jgi:hypothetical protein
MRENITSFDTSRHHIYLEFGVTDSSGVLHSVAGILDTGAPRTEFSDQFLKYAGFLNDKNENATLKLGLQTQKYGVIELPLVDLCGHQMVNFKACVSYFEPSWGIDALIGLDFFRYFRVTIDFEQGVIITSPYV